MKIRTRFVSNSSSSSFIVMFGVIEDKNKFNSWIEDLNIELDNYKYTISIGSLCSLLTKEDFLWNKIYNKDTKILTINSDIDGCLDVDLKDLLEKDPEVFILTYSGNEGDCGFMVNYDYIDYSRWKDVISTKFLRLYEEAGKNKSGLSNVDYIAGAGRDG